MYCIKDTFTGKIIKDGFKNRESAKPERNKLNKKHDKDGKQRYVVSIGKDHPRYVNYHGD